MLDLHEGVLELFAEAQRLGQRYRVRGVFLPPSESQRRGRKISRALRAAWRALRARSRPRRIVHKPCASEPGTCPRCGARTELREGLTHPIHFGACTAFPELR